MPFNPMIHEINPLGIAKALDEGTLIAANFH